MQQDPRRASCVLLANMADNRVLPPPVRHDQRERTLKEQARPA